MKHRAVLASALIALMASAALASGCSKQEPPVVVTEIAATENTGTVTPLERGKIRREAMADMRDFVAAWMDSDVKTMGTYLPSSNLKKFEATWKKYDAQGLKVKHVHDVSEFDVTQFNKAATQATVSYTYKDKSYLVDKNGNKVRSLPEVKEDASITVVRKDNKSTDWTIQRFYVAEKSYR